MQQAMADWSEDTSPKMMGMHPIRFALWLFIVSILMIFAALTSAYIVRKAEGNWLDFRLPASFIYTTSILLLSSVTMHMAYRSATYSRHAQVRSWLVVTFLLGCGFLIGQFAAWSDLVDMNVYFVGNPSGSFLYVLSGLHGFHIISGLVYLIIILISSLRMRVHAGRLEGIQMCATFWHFLDGLWIYLYLFLLYNHA